MIKVVAAPNAMKGSLTASLAADAIESGVIEAFKLFNAHNNKKIDFQVIKRPVADGGDDTLDAIAENTYITDVTGPFQQRISAKWGSRGNTAIIEMAKASGIALQPPEQLDPFKATTYGTGELIQQAIKKGFKDILLTIGGSATVEGGIGVLSALGCKFYDSRGKRVEHGNDSTGLVSKVDLDDMISLTRGINFSIACDVNNPLLGPKGAAAVFGPQKLSPKIRNSPIELKRCVELMESNIANFATRIEQATGNVVRDMPGCGAAGGFPLGFCSILGAKMQTGAKLVLDLLNFSELKGSDIVITCEGMCDSQTLHGKGPFAVCEFMKGSHIVMLSGGIQDEFTENQMLKAGASIVESICDSPASLQSCCERAAELIKRASKMEVYSYLSAKY